MTRSEVEELATYNAEKARGIVHTPEVNERMYLLQNKFDMGHYQPPASTSLFEDIFGFKLW